MLTHFGDVMLNFCSQIAYALLGYRHILVLNLHEQDDFVDVRSSIGVAMIRRPTMNYATLHASLWYPMLPAGTTTLLSHPFVWPNHIYTSTQIDSVVYLIRVHNLLLEKLVSLFVSILISLLLRSPAKLASVELVGFPTEASEPLLPPREPVFARPREPRPVEPPI
ncbi:hypothetical protein ALC53_08154 [Atta colombica]|uniref:Uncharacterized protein n=1 Tax=Atta colombica TaxID=520822 RepID=A0A195BA27_9HYME|nr:hypothetical protein ALC53_08154 [Atta colombica]